MYQPARIEKNNQHGENIGVCGWIARGIKLRCSGAAGCLKILDDKLGFFAGAGLLLERE